MKFAINENNQKIEVTISGERAKCPCCFSEVVGNFGKVKSKYWRHLAKDCDTWYEPMSDWHLEWQNYFPKENQEITLRNSVDNVLHRADVQLNNGLVIEIQNSPIKIQEIEHRENFYGKKNMIWVINGKTLAPNSFISYPRIRKIYFIVINLPLQSQIFKSYTISELQSHFRNTIVFHELYNYTKNYTFAETANGFKFEFIASIDFERIQREIKLTLNEISEKLYGPNFYDSHNLLFNLEFGIRHKSKSEGVSLYKKRWKIFLDYIRFPMFIENIPGLDDGHLYWYQKNEIISKQKFLEKYLAYT